jgi:hypothetical protein
MKRAALLLLGAAMLLAPSSALAGHLVSAKFEIGKPRKHHRHRR